MAVVGRAVHSPHSCRGAEASCGLRAGTTLENTTTGRTCTATTTLPLCYTYNGCCAQAESPQSVQTYCVLVVGLLQDGEEEVRDEMAASMGYILAHISLSFGM